MKLRTVRTHSRAWPQPGEKLAPEAVLKRRNISEMCTYHGMFSRIPALCGTG